MRLSFDRRNDHDVGHAAHDADDRLDAGHRQPAWLLRSSYGYPDAARQFGAWHYYVGGISDYNNRLTESNESNNTYNALQVTVTAPAQPDLIEYLVVNNATVAAGSGLTFDAYI
ncbi:hypothetical protein [Bradyrhizobium sp. LA2.1]|uniref:hypothetical protein n=1 Tax=Bradyrhizobium sp. LA2.1 TaxID=3156376 RepID=UPI00339B2FE5